jgi:aminoglycoside 6'-N-acetyltransferase I
MMPVEIRILRGGEEAVLHRVASGVFDDPIDPQRAKEFLNDPRHHLAVAIDEETVIGFASATHYVHPDKPQPELWINELGVSPTHQNRGIGKSLMRVLFQVARDLGCVEAWVLTERDNQPAMHLYQSLGGEEAPEETVMFTFHL